MEPSDVVRLGLPRDAGLPNNGIVVPINIINLKAKEYHDISSKLLQGSIVHGT